MEETQPESKKLQEIKSYSVEIFNILLNLNSRANKINHLNIQEFKTSLDIAYNKFDEVYKRKVLEGIGDMFKNSTEQTK